MAEQLNHTNSEIVYIDFSRASMSFAQKRILMRRCSKIVWVADWIENIPRLGLSKFDLVQCIGVLHHLKRPQMGLDILKERLVQNGGLSLMMYAKYGRTGVYQIQYLLGIINTHQKTMLIEIEEAKIILKMLPAYHWAYHIPYISMIDPDTAGNIRIYDLLLHKRDLSYSVPDLIEYLEPVSYTHLRAHET